MSERFNQMNNEGTITNGLCVPDLSLRDWFAGQAIIGWMIAEERPPLNAYDKIGLAEASYEIADALLAERSNRSEAEDPE